MMVRLQQRLIYQAVAIPFILVRMNLWKVDRFLDQCRRRLRLRNGLSVHLSDPGCRAVGGDNH